jgi:hypothetical protein
MNISTSHEGNIIGGFAQVHQGPVINYNGGDQCLADEDKGTLLDHVCLQYVHQTDPRRDKERIEQTKGGLIEGCYKWVLDHPGFRRWRCEKQGRLLWIKGDAGKGKTMLLIGIINELCQQTRAPDASLLSFFLCQGTDATMNSATAVLRGLIYLLIRQETRLISHLHTEYCSAGRKLLENKNAFYTLSAIFQAMLRDPNLTEAYLVVDALDECEEDSTELLELIVRTTSTPSSKVKWIVSSRNRPDIQQLLDPDNTGVRLSLEVNAELVSQAVDKYIELKVSQLSVLRNNQTLQDEIRNRMGHKANGTFLWVALVFMELQTVGKHDMLDVLDEVPEQLSPLYDRMMSHILRLKRRRDPKFCRLVLSVATLAYRPLHWLELRTLAGLQDQDFDFAAFERIIHLCGSFLTTREDYVYLIHQSAKDYLTNDASETIFPIGLGPIHFNIFSCSLNTLSNTLRKDIYNLQHPGFPIDKVKKLDPDPLVVVRYSSVYWIDHFCQVNDQSPKCKMALSNDGEVLSFFKVHFLHWLECLSLLGRISDAVGMVRKLYELISVCQ